VDTLLSERGPFFILLPAGLRYEAREDRHGSPRLLLDQNGRAFFALLFCNMDILAAEYGNLGDDDVDDAVFVNNEEGNLESVSVIQVFL
jgi:hypothetical protein